MTKDEYINSNPYIKLQSKTLKQRLYENNESNRLSLIERGKIYRENIIDDYYMTTPESQNGVKVNYFAKKPNIELQKRCCDKNEYFYMVKKQNLQEVKNLIDHKIKLYEKGVKYDKKTKKYISDLMEKNKLIYLKRVQSAKNLLEQEKTQINLEKINQENSKKIFLRQTINFDKRKQEEEEKKMFEAHEKFMKNKEEWEFERYLHREKIKNINKSQHDKLYNNYMNSLNKFEKNKKKLKKQQSENELMGKVKRLQEFHIKCKVYASREKSRKIQQHNLDIKYENIRKNIEEQHKIRNDIINSQKKNREQKIQNGIFLRKLNDCHKEEKKLETIKRLEKAEKCVELTREIKKKINEEKIYQNLVWEDKMMLNISEINNKLAYKNMGKLKKMKEKTEKIKEKFKIREQTANQNIQRDNWLKYKKGEMMNCVNDIFEEGKLYDKDKVYDRVFSREEMKILLENKN